MRGALAGQRAPGLGNCDSRGLRRRCLHGAHRAISARAGCDCAARAPALTHTLRPEQRTASAWLLAPVPPLDPLGAQLVGAPGRLLLAPMGTGKTAILLDAVGRLQGHELPAFVLAPKRVADDVWPTEAVKWAPLLRFVRYSKKAPLETIRAAQLVVIHFEQLPEFDKRIGAKIKPRTLIVDESGKLKGYRRSGGTIRGKLTFRFRRGAAHFWMATAAPAGNSLESLWPQMFMADGGGALGATKAFFVERYMKPAYPGALYHVMKTFADNELLGAVAESPCVRRLIPSRTAAEHIAIIHNFTLDPRERAAFGLMDKKGAAEGVAAANSADRGAKLAQIVSGFLYGDNVTITLGESKIHALAELVEEIAEPVIICYEYIEELRQLRAAFPAAVLLTDKGAVVAWNAGQVAVLLMSPKSAAHGLNLQWGGRHIIFFTAGVDGDDHQQAIGRIGPARQASAGFDRDVFAHYLRGSAECGRRMSRLTRKRDTDAGAVAATLAI